MPSMPFNTQLIMPRFPQHSGLSLISSGRDYYMEYNETSSGGQNTTIRKKTELTIREELQKDVDEWLGDMV